MAQPRPEASGLIRIVKVPPGEAPRWVRQNWVGLTLPCMPICDITDEPNRGVLSGMLLEPRYAFDVPQREALEILSEMSPRAAAWWRAHGYPEENQCFNFEHECAKVIRGVRMLAGNTRHEVHVLNPQFALR